mgnify:CR=1 FL=1|jgi:hypothetical protein
MYRKKPVVHKSPDLAKMQAVIIDNRTVIYIEAGSDAEEAKERYLSRPGSFKRP